MRITTVFILFFFCIVYGRKEGRRLRRLRNGGFCERAGRFLSNLESHGLQSYMVLKTPIEAPVSVCDAPGTQGSPLRRTCCLEDARDALMSGADQYVHHAINSLTFGKINEFMTTLGHYGKDIANLLSNETAEALAEEFDATYKCKGACAAAFPTKLLPSLPRAFRGRFIDVEKEAGRLMLQVSQSMAASGNNSCHLVGAPSPQYATCLLARAEEHVKRNADLLAAQKTMLAGTLGKAYTLSAVIQRIADVMVNVSHGMSQVKLSRECIQAVTRMRYCSYCSAVVTPQPCADYCRNTFNGCWWPVFKRLHQPWQDLIKSIKQFYGSGKAFRGIERETELKFRSSLGAAISIAWEGLSDEKAGKPCREDCMTRSELLQQIRTRRSAAPKERKLKEGHWQKYAIKSGTGYISKMAEVFHQVPGTVCYYKREISKKNDKCWNGTALGSYTRGVMRMQHHEQLRNPEVRHEGQHEPALNHKLEELAVQIRGDIQFIEKATALIQGAETDEDWATVYAKLFPPTLEDLLAGTQPPPPRDALSDDPKSNSGGISTASHDVIVKIVKGQQTSSENSKSAGKVKTSEVTSLASSTVFDNRWWFLSWSVLLHLSCYYNPT